MICDGCVYQRKLFQTIYKAIKLNLSTIRFRYDIEVKFKVLSSNYLKCLQQQCLSLFC